MRIAIANRKNRCDFGALSLWILLKREASGLQGVNRIAAQVFANIGVPLPLQSRHLSSPRCTRVCTSVVAPSFRQLERAAAVRNSSLEKFSGKFRRCWKVFPWFSGSAKCYPCGGLGIFRQGKWLLENRPRLRERCWMFSSETATAFLSSPDS